MSKILYFLSLLILLTGCQRFQYVRQETLKLCDSCEPPPGQSQLSVDNTPATLMGSVDGEYDPMNDRGLRIRDVRLTPQYTVVYMQFNNKGRPIYNDAGRPIRVGYIHVRPDNALTTTASAHRFRLVKVEGVPVWPEMLRVKPVDQINFVLYFERLDKGLTSFNWDECKDTDRHTCWRFYNVKVNNPPDSTLIPIPLSDSLAADSLAANDIRSVPLRVGAKIVLRNIYFPASSATVLPESFTELNRLFIIMQANPQLTIRLEGHTDIVGNHTKNYQLSMARVQACQHYLTRKGIDVNRIKVVGYGDAKPLVRKGPEQNRSVNRRVECVILTL